MILVIDNYDSFTFNLVQALQTLGAEVEVFRNDAIDVEGVRGLRPEALVLSPGPCTPNEAGICVPLIRALSGKLPILGVCLGHQSIGQAFGGTVRRASRGVHGKSSEVRQQASSRGLPGAGGGALPLAGGGTSTLPACPGTTATAADDGELMALRHRTHPTVGVQFHPESILTPDGPRLLGNFLRGQLG